MVEIYFAKKIKKIKSPMVGDLMRLCTINKAPNGTGQIFVVFNLFIYCQLV